MRLERTIAAAALAAALVWTPLAADATDATDVVARIEKRLGGAAAWDATHHVRWRFFGGRLHHWDKWTGDIRIDSPRREDRPARTVLMNVHSKKGRVWEDGQPVTDPAALDKALDLGHQWWVNDSYWMFMPYKLRDPGVRLVQRGERPMADGRIADVLELTFDTGIGYTPENKYEVFVARDTDLVEQWAFYEKATDAEPGFTDPWKDWQQFGKIWLATAHGREAQWDVAVFDELPRSVYTDPAPVKP